MMNGGQSLIILAALFSLTEGALSLLQIRSGGSKIDVCVAFDPESFGFEAEIPEIPTQTPSTSFIIDNQYSKGSAAFCNNNELSYKPQSGALKSATLLERGNCTFQEKAENLKKVQTDTFGIINVNYADEKNIIAPGPNDTAQNPADQLKMFVGMISKESYDKISALGSQSNEDMIGSLYYPVSSSPFDLTLLPVWFLAVTCIAIGAILSGCEKSGTKFGNNYNRSNYNRNISSDSEVAIVVESDDESDVQQFTTKQVGVWLIVTTTWLLLLYFFYDYLVFWMIGVFCFCGSLAMIQLLFNNIFIHLACTEKHKCPTCSSCRWPILDCIPKCLFRDGPPITLVALTLCCFGFSITWAVFRHESWAWILQDIIGYFFCVFTITELRFNSYKMLFLLLAGFCLYDVFMVYITPYLTPQGDSIMVTVATGGGSKEKIPFLFLVPKINPSIVQQLCMANQFSMLGYGDIIIPGFLGGYCAYFDMVNKHAHYYYYFMFIFSYGVGLILTFLALILSGKGQPALFFLVPCTLGSLTVLAYIRGELRCFWNGPKFKESQN